MTRLILLVALLLPVPAEISPDPNQTPSDEHPCLAYDPEVIRLSGIIGHRTFTGPAGHGKGASVDKPEIVWILKLLIPICTTGSNGVWPSESAVREVQIVAPGELLHALAAVEGRPVMVIGTLFHSHSGNHHTPVLILLEDLSSGDRRGPGVPGHAPALLARSADAPLARRPITILS